MACRPGGGHPAPDPAGPVAVSPERRSAAEAVEGCEPQPQGEVGAERPADRPGPGAGLGPGDQEAGLAGGGGWQAAAAGGDGAGRGQEED